MQKTNKRKIITLLSSFGFVSLLSIPIIASCSGQFKKPHREDWNFIQWGDKNKKDVLNIGRPDASLKMKFINFDDNQEDQEDTNPNILLHTKYDLYSSYDEFLKKEDYYLNNLISKDVRRQLLTFLIDVDFTKKDIIMLFNYREFNSNYHLDIRKNDWLIFKNINQVNNNIDVETYYRSPINQNKGIPLNQAIDNTLYPKDYLLIVDKNPSNIVEYKIKVNDNSHRKKDLDIVVKKYQPS